MCLGSWTSRGFINYTQTGLLLVIVINLYIKDPLDPSFCTEANIFIHIVTHSYSCLMSWSFILTVTAPSSYCVVTETSQTVGDGHGEARHWTENPGEVWARMQHIQDMMRTWGSRRLCWVYPICPFRLCCDSLCVCVFVCRLRWNIWHLAKRIPQIMNESPQQAGLPMSLAGLMVLYVCVRYPKSPAGRWLSQDSHYPAGV